MRILEILGSAASLISLVIAVGFQWQGTANTQRNIAIVCLFIFAVLTLLVLFLNTRIKKKPQLQSPDDLTSRIDSYEFDDLFKDGNPYPTGFQAAKLGMKLTVLQKLFPSFKNKLNADLLSSTFSLEIPTGTFSRVVYYLSDTEADPKVRQITFWFRDERSAELVRASALRSFDTKKVKTKTLGRII